MLNSKETLVFFSKETRVETESFCEYHIIGSSLTFLFDKKKSIFRTLLKGNVVAEDKAEVTSEMFFRMASQMCIDLMNERQKN
jgi:hypothetical protein